MGEIFVGGRVRSASIGACVGRTPRACLPQPPGCASRVTTASFSPSRRLRCRRSSFLRKKKKKATKEIDRLAKQASNRSSEQKQAEAKTRKSSGGGFAVRSVAAAVIMVVQRKEIGTPVEDALTDVEISLHCSIKKKIHPPVIETKSRP